VAQQDDTAQQVWPAASGSVAGTGAALRASERQFEQEFGSAPCGMFMISLATGPVHTYLAVNDTFCQLTGYSRGDLADADFRCDFHPDEQPALDILIGQIMSGETSQIQADTRMVTKSGEIICVRLTGAVIQPATGERYLATYIQDATEAEQARAEMHGMELELQRSRRLDSLGQLVGGIAHDFNNMLTVITNYASLVREEVTIAETTDSATRWGPVRWDVEQIEDAADRAKRLIKHMLAFARREESQPGAVDLGQLTQDVSGLLGEVLGEHVPVITRHGPGLWPVEADAGHLEQAIINIALNARDAMPGGGQVTIETANIDTTNLTAGGPGPDREDLANLAELLPGHYVQVRVTDTGAGMDAMIAERAFEPFFTTKGGDQAAGLGLAAVRRIAVQAGGTAWLRSVPGRGTTVTITLPAAAGSAAAGAAAQNTDRSAEPAAVVLVVDDEAAIREVAHRVLTSAGYQVITAVDGPAALHLLSDPATAADLLLTDVIMPGMTGQAFAAQAQQIRPGLHMLFMSGYEQQSTTADWPQTATPIIAKPFSRAALLARVAQALAANPAAGASAAPAPASTSIVAGEPELALIRARHTEARDTEARDTEAREAEIRHTEARHTEARYPGTWPSGT
jgi:PAS domain S-box-containing protein